MSRLTAFCDGWEFSKQPIDTPYSPDFSWARVDIPHDWLIYDTRNLYETSTGWYRKTFHHAKNNSMLTFVRFEGVYIDCRVFCNGSLVGEWKYGYSTFELDLTAFLRDGENVLTVMVNHRAPNSRWYSGAGIYRKVYLRELALSHIVPDGVYITTAKRGAGFDITVSTECARSCGAALESYQIRTTLLAPDGAPLQSILSAACAADKSCIDAAVRRENTDYSVNTQSLRAESPVLWDIGQGTLYTLQTELLVAGKAVDCALTRFGFRTMLFTPDQGFFLNGRHVKIHGCCEHHDLGALGAAVNRAAIRRKLTKLRAMGINAVRTSHNMPATEFMELADEMGFLVVSEGFDMWERQKTQYDYARFFGEWVEKDIASWVRRDRNSPSLIAWSIGNEIYDTHADDRGQEVTALLTRLVRLHDSRANAYVTIGSNYMGGENAQKCADIVKLAGYNYGERLYAEHHAAHPDWMIYGSETASVIQSRGVYHFPLAKTILTDDDEQCSSIGNCCTAWGAKNTESCIIPDRDADYCAGQFIWTGFDYIGEPTPYATKNSYFGQLDTAGFEKDSFYVFQSEWTCYRTNPMIHIFPYWDFNEGQMIDVRVATNAPRLELFFNGASLGATDIDHAHGTRLTGDYQLAFTDGVLEALAYDEQGNIIARDTVRSFGECAALALSADKQTLTADGEDLIFVELTALDAAGTFAANANNRVLVEVTGAGRLVGLDNGDSTDYDPYKTTSRRLFSGKLLAIIAAKKQPGELHIRVSSVGLPDAELVLEALPGIADDGVSATEECIAQLPECGGGTDIPVRKIKLSADARELNATVRTAQIRVEVFPPASTYAQAISYRITTDTGIDTNIAAITAIEDEDGCVTVEAQGDGECFLRALCKNGTDKYHVISVLPLTVSGLGNVSVNPYEFVTAGLYTASSGDLCSAIEQGASFSHGPSWFGFKNVDFGMIGSDTVTISVYANMLTPTSLSVWDGIPGVGGVCLGEFSYQKEPIWLTYQPETFHLSRRLKGVHTIAFMGTDSVSVKGFAFEKTDKEFARINAADCLTVYGDKFTVGDTDVTGIGNNVVLEFGAFDFTSHQPAAVVITGRSLLPKTSIHLCFEDGDTRRILLEFDGCEAYTERTFPVSGIAGSCRLSFTFLPGTEFDFRDFRFVE
ncbi:MAG: glycoside hydrolase family 2 TIM barrel-domain containing protein [Oscillospiraceae bacterium]